MYSFLLHTYGLEGVPCFEFLSWHCDQSSFHLPKGQVASLPDSPNVTNVAVASGGDVHVVMKSFS